MAQDTTGNIWKITTSGSIRTNPVYVKAMWWTPTTTGDDIDIQDAGGDSIWAYKCIAGSTNEEITYEWPGKPGMLNGINVVTIDNGTLYIQVN